MNTRIRRQNKKLEQLSITRKIENARRDLQQIQQQIISQCTKDLLKLEKETILKLEKWSLIEESAMQPKARATWIKLGDANTKYLSAVVKERQNKKQILELVSLTGKSLSDPEDIKKGGSRFP